MVNKTKAPIDYDRTDYLLRENNHATNFDSILFKINGDDMYKDLLENGSLNTGTSKTATLIGIGNPKKQLKMSTNAIDSSKGWLIKLN